MKPSPTAVPNEEALDGSAAAAPNFRVRKQLAVREIIWDAAIDLFVERGYDETTVDEVAQAAGISPRSFFRYFAAKGDLMSYAFVTYANQLIAAIDECPETYSIGEVVRETVNRVAREALAHPRTRKIFKILSKSPAAAAAELSRLAEVQKLVADAIVRRFSGKGEDQFTAAVLAGITLQMTGVTIRWCFEDESDVSVAMGRLFATVERIFCVNASRTVQANPHP